MRKLHLFPVLLAIILALSGCMQGILPEHPDPVLRAAKSQPLPPIKLDPREHSAIYYGRRTLSGTEIEAYDRISQAIREQCDTVETRGVDYERLFELCELVLEDHPEYFWFDGTAKAEYFENDESNVVTLSFTYTIEKDKAQTVMQQLESRTAPLCSALTGRSDYDKVRGVYEYVIEHTAYDESCEDQSLCSVLLNGKGVCAGYTRAVQYLLQQLGIETLYVSGTAEGESHSWNIVKLDGKYYALDATWGDPVADNGEQVILYDYLCVTSQELARSHQSEQRVPECTSTDYDYYRLSGCLFSGCRDGRVYEQLKAALDRGEGFGMKFTSQSAYAEAKRLLFDNGEIQLLLSRYCEETGRTLGSYTWSANDHMYVIHFEAME